MDIDTLKALYFANAADIEIDGESVPQESSGNNIEALIDGYNYFGSISGEITRLLSSTQSGRFFYFTDWWLGLVKPPVAATTGASAFTHTVDLSYLAAFELNDGSTGPFPLLALQLADMAAAGIDVRGMVWCSEFVTPYIQIASKHLWDVWSVNVHSLLSVAYMRTRSGLEESFILYTRTHPVGALHMKAVVCGDSSSACAYLGGLDFVSDRVSGNDHPSNGTWHDAGVRIEGPAVQSVYDYVRDLWNECVMSTSKTFFIAKSKVNSVELLTQGIPDIALPMPSSAGTAHIQVLRTVPLMNLSSLSTKLVPTTNAWDKLLLGFPENPISFAVNGLFEFRLATKKAISHAINFIYIEDEGFTSIETFGWINDRLKNAPTLRVIFLYGADPTDPKNIALPEAINNYLVSGVANAADRVAFYVKTSATIHSKITIVDDSWAVIGSANCARRSLYTDIELSVGVLDEASPGFAQKLRRDLWFEHCDRSTVTAANALLDVADALGVWKSTWGTVPSGAKLRSDIIAKKVPFVVGTAADEWTTLEAFDQTLYDQGDPDSRLEY